MDTSFISLSDSIDNFSVIDNCNIRDNVAQLFASVTRKLPSLITSIMAHKKYVTSYD